MIAPSLVPLAVLLVVGMALVPGSALAPPTPVPSPSVGALLSPPPPASTACAGPTLPSSFAGSLVVDGGPTPLPSVAGRTVSLSYFVRETYTPSGGGSTVSCIGYRSSNLTDALGGFTIVPAITSGGCTHTSCTSYTGPVGPLSASVLNGTPAGYFVTGAIDGPQVTVSYVYALSEVVLDPTGRATLSTNAPTVLRATPMAGDGSGSPAAVSYAWDLPRSTGWSVVGGASSPNLTVEAANGAGPTELGVWVNGTYNGTPETAAPVYLSLAAISTTALNGNVHPSSLDVGVPAVFDVRGSGALGYAYDAEIFVGVGPTTVTAPCVENGTSGATEYLDCQASISYNSTGIVEPSATVTNGFSSATSDFPTLTIVPAPAVEVDPLPVVTYTGDPTAIEVSVAPGTGTNPLGPACLSTGNGREMCETGPGPSYPFDVEWGSAGTYDAAVTVPDNAGANVSVPIPVEVYDRLNASWVSSGSLNPGNLGGSYDLTASVQGGALPLSYWWNLSSGSTLLAGTLGADGTLYYSYTPHTVGWANVTLEVIDRLGARQEVPFPALVVPGDPTSVSIVEGGGAGVVMAGDPYPVAWDAVDPQGIVTPQFQSSEELLLSAPNGSAVPATWVNGSAGPVPLGSGGLFEVPPADWNNGRLALTVTVGGTGSFDLSLIGPLPEALGPDGAPTLEVTPNLDHLRLWSPQAVDVGSRASATLYRITDEFDDNLSGGYLWIRETFGPQTTGGTAGIFGGTEGSMVWVNFTDLSTSAGSVNVTYETEGISILTVAVPAAAGAVSSSVLLGAVGLAIVAVAAGAFLLLRRRRSPSGSGEVPAATEEELRRLSEGRVHVLAHADPTIARTLDELAGNFPGRPPSPEEVTEWVASLVADGSLASELGPDGRSRFRLTAPPPPAPRVELDDRALDEALRRRNEGDLDGPEPDGPAP